PAAELLPAAARPLLWQGEQPLAWLETVQGTPRLVFGWNWAASNADRLPASAVLLHRVIEDARRRKAAPETRNVDAGQHLEILQESAPATAGQGARAAPVWTLQVDDAAPRTLNSEELAALRAPARPGF